MTSARYLKSRGKTSPEEKSDVPQHMDNQRILLHLLQTYKAWDLAAFCPNANVGHILFGPQAGKALSKGVYENLPY